MKNEFVYNQELYDRIRFIRGRKVILDYDLATLYDVSTGRLNEQVKRNLSRFPEDFMFQLTEIEQESLISQIAISKQARGGRRFLPYAFTEHGILMVANVLNNPKAINVSIEIVRLFIQLRQALSVNENLKQKLLELEEKYDNQFQVVFETIKQLLAPQEVSPRRIGITSDDFNN